MLVIINFQFHYHYLLCYQTANFIAFSIYGVTDDDHSAIEGRSPDHEQSLPSTSCNEDLSDEEVVVEEITDILTGKK